jgi:hypothetical protein
MEELERIIAEIEKTPYTADQKCVELLDNHLQDIIKLLSAHHLKASSEWLGLKDCTWTLHERYHMDSEEQLKWTFHHTKHRILKNSESLLFRLKTNKAA